MKIQCLKVDQPVGVFYLAMIKSSFLKNVCYTKSAKYENGSIVGAQRESNSKTLGEIRDFVQTEKAAIPNTIILAANYTEDDEFVLEPSQRWEIVEEDGNVFLEIPDSELKICSVVDGQHRLKGIVESGVDIELPCSVFVDLPPSLQAYIFSTINFNQKRVDKSLAYQLFGYQLDDTKSSSWTPDLLAVHLSRYFNEQGPLLGRIRLIKTVDSREQGGWSISSAAFIGGVVSLISSNLNKDKYAVNKKSIFGIAGRKALEGDSSKPLRDYYISGNDKAIKMVFERFFSALGGALWRGRADDDILFKTVGIASQFKLLSELLLENTKWKDDENYFVNRLGDLSSLNFEGEYFSPRSATTTRLLNVFKLKLGVGALGAVDEQVKNACG